VQVHVFQANHKCPIYKCITLLQPLAIVRNSFILLVVFIVECIIFDCGISPTIIIIGVAR